MRVVTAEPTRTTLALKIAPRERHRAHVESLALAVTTIAVALGLWLAYRQQVAEATAANAVRLGKFDCGSRRVGPCSIIGSVYWAASPRAWAS